MEFSYSCPNNNCSYPGKNQFTMTIDEQAVMDDKNMAAVFCPFCKKEMTFCILDGKSMAGDKPVNRLH